MTRRDIAWRLRPPWPADPHPLTSWVADLIADRGLSVRLGATFAALGRQGVIELPGSGVVTDADVAAMLHEIGHCVDPRDRPWLEYDEEPPDHVVRLDGEAFAWLGAQEIAGRKWNQGMQTCLTWALEGYGRKYARTPAERRMIADTIAFTAARLRTRGVVSLRPGGGAPPVEVPDTIRSLVHDWRSVWPR